MKRKYLLIAVAMATCFVAQASSATPASGSDGSMGRLDFTGRIVNSACSSSLPPLGVQGGMGRCGTAIRIDAAYVEHERAVTGSSGIDMLDYFAGRADGGSKRVLTRQYL